MQSSALLRNLQVHVNVVAISNSKRMLLSREALQLTNWQQSLQTEVGKALYYMIIPDLHFCFLLQMC